MTAAPKKIGEPLLIIVLVCLCLALFFPNIEKRPMWDIDEGKHATTSKEMVLTGDWITPRYNGENFYDKPILYNWLAALAFVTLGINEFAARLPAALLGLGCVLVTYFLGRRMFGVLGGFFGAVVLATSGEYIVLSRVVVHDICLVFFMTLALFLFYAGYTDARRRVVYFPLMYAAGGGAVLAKGPLGLLLPAIIIGLYLVSRRRLEFLKEMRIGWGILIFLAVAAPWYLMISLKNPDYAAYFFLQKNVASFLGSSTVKMKHVEPFYYHFGTLVSGFLPWSVFLPFACYRAVRGRFRAVENGTALLLIWLCTVFVFFSLAKSKLPTYILPLFPAAALLVGALFAEVVKSPSVRLHRGILFSFLPVVAALPIALIYIGLFPPHSVPRTTGISLTQIHVLVSGIGVWILVAFALLIRKRHRAFFSSIVMLMLVAITVLTTYLIPLANPYRSTKILSEKIDRMMPPGDDLVFYRREKESALFYTRRNAKIIKRPKQLRAYLASAHEVYFITEDKYLDNIQHLIPQMHEIAREGNNMIFSNKKPV